MKKEGDIEKVMNFFEWINDAKARWGKMLSLSSLIQLLK